MNRIVLRIDGRWNERIVGDAFPCTLRVVSRDGDEVTVEVPFAPGHPRNRLNASGVEDKFSRNVSGILDDRQRNSLVQTVQGFESLPSVHVLMRQLVLP